MPHSDIRGSTIARISPRLFAACHVLHRLLAPRHPPDALLTLITPHIHRPRAGPNRTPQHPKPKSLISPQARTPAHKPNPASSNQVGRSTSQLTHTHRDTYTPHTPHPSQHAPPQAQPHDAYAPPQLPIPMSTNRPQHTPKAQHRGNQCREAHNPSLVKGSRAMDGGDRIRTDDPLLAKQALSH